MATVYRKIVIRKLPADAEIFTRKGERLAKWKDRRGKNHTAQLTAGRDGSDRITVLAGTYTAKYRDGQGVVREVATGCRDETAARQVLADLQRRVELVKTNVISAAEDAVARVLELFFDWLGVEQGTPTRTSIRNWLQRLGIAELQQPLKPNEDLVVMVNHSNQIGTEKVLVALGVNASALPEPGSALKHEDVRVLEVKPGSQWKTENMEQEYEELADRLGTPRAVLVDGAVELRDGVKCLENRGSDTIVLRDFKHYAANVMKSLIGNDQHFQEVGGKIGSTRTACP